MVFHNVVSRDLFSLMRDPSNTAAPVRITSGANVVPGRIASNAHGDDAPEFARNVSNV